MPSNLPIDGHSFRRVEVLTGTPRRRRWSAAEKAAIVAVDFDGEDMRVLTILELIQMTRIELCDLAARITNALPEYPERSEAYANARINLRNIRVVLSTRALALR